MDTNQANFVAQRFYIDAISAAGPTFDWDGGIHASRESAKTKPSPKLKRQVYQGKVKGIFRAVFGSVDGAIQATVLSVASAMKAEEKGDITTAPVGDKVKGLAESFVMARITPQVKEAFRFMLLQKSERKVNSPLVDLAFQVGDDSPVLLRGTTGTLETDKAALAGLLNPTFTCESCGHVQTAALGKIVDPEPVRTARAEKTQALRLANREAKKAEQDPARQKARESMQKEAQKVTQIKVKPQVKPQVKKAVNQ